jgi:phospholipase B1
LAKALLESPAFPGITNRTTSLKLANLIVSRGIPEDSEQEPEISNGAFPCPNTGRSNPRPTSAQKLLPGDIDIVIGLGDSIVAAFGALSTSIINVFTQWRGYSFCIGGQTNYDNYVSIPNILKNYNPNVKGFSVGNGDQNNVNAVLNVAVSGARSADLMVQVDALVAKLRNYDIQNSWKLVSLFIGGNDLCDYCNDPTHNSPENYRFRVERALDAIKARIPKVFVNLISPPDITLLGEINEGLCGVLHPFECSCATDDSTHQIYSSYIKQLDEIQDLPKYHDKEDFHVVYQPFLAEIQIPMKDGKPDLSYFAPDCFHFSGKAHQAAAIALWNNMVEPDDKKKTWFPGEMIECPATGQYLS